MTLLKAFPVAGTLAVIMAQTVAAQVASPSADESSKPSLSDVAQRAGSSSLAQPVSDDNGIQFSTNQDASSVTAKWSWKGPSAFLDNIAVTGSVPLTSGATAVNVGSLDTMANGAWVGLTASGINVLGRSTTVDENARQALCTEHWKHVNATGGNVDTTKTCQLSDLLAPSDWQLRREYEQLFFAGPVLLWGLTGKFGYQQYKFFAQPSLAADVLRTTPWSFGGYFAYQPGVVSNTLVTASYQHQYGYDPGSAKIACPPGSSGGKGCVEGTIGPPPPQTKDLFTLDLRHRFITQVSWLPDVAVEISPSYDARSHIWAIDSPLYFIGDGKGALSGGLDLGWRSDKHHVTVGLFVKKPFGLSPG
jgi:hypothetical protein